MTDENASRLLRPLRGEPDGQPGFDVARAMAEGRRRRGLRRWTTGAALLAVTTVTAGGGTFAVAAMQPDPTEQKPAPVPSVAPSMPVAAPVEAAPPKSCEVTLLPTGGVRKSLVTAGDPSGRHHAGRLYDAAENVIIWTNGKIDAKVRMPGKDASIGDINRSGIGVATSYHGSTEQAYVYRDGEFTVLDGTGTRAFAINDAGVIVGGIGDFQNQAPVRWNTAGAKLERLPVPDEYPFGMATDIAEDGTVLGAVGDGRFTATAYLWLPDGTGKELPLPTVNGRKADSFSASSIADGWIYGMAVFVSSDQTTPGANGQANRELSPVKYRLADGTYHPVPAETGIGFGHLADNGWILALAGDKPVIVSGSRVTRLPEYQRYKEYQVTSLSADGTKAGGYSTDMGPEEVDNRPFLWTCK
ncbi:MAG TPA: hypothetical protein VN408_04680 [Actinoplanes sp.]|nr:hypothetical protein [Actinoplanes sp.]